MRGYVPLWEIAAQAVLAILGLLALWLTPRRPVLALTLGLLDEVSWTAYVVATGSYGFALSIPAYTGVFVSNYLRQRKEITPQR